MSNTCIIEWHISLYNLKYYRCTSEKYILEPSTYVFTYSQQISIHAFRRSPLLHYLIFLRFVAFVIFLVQVFYIRFIGTHGIHFFGTCSTRYYLHFCTCSYCVVFCLSAVFLSSPVQLPKTYSTNTGFTLIIFKKNAGP